MNITQKILLTFLVVAVLCHCTINPSQPEDNNIRDLTSVEKNLVKSGSKFGLKLFQNIVKNEKDKNVFISPLSVSLALGMTLNGASSSTKQAMQNTLEVVGLTDEQMNRSYQSLIELLIELDSKVKFQIANSIWYRSTFPVEQSFIEVNKQYFNAQVSGLDFNDPSSINVINSWVQDNTNSKIQEIIDQINPLTVMLLINAIYFKGSWTYQFDENNTTDAPFYLADNSENTCRLMNIYGTFNYFSSEKFNAIDLPYGDQQFSMIVILPQSAIEVDDLIAELNFADWNSWIANFKETEVEIYLPKFKLEYEKSLKEVLAQLGMGIAFSGQADFTRINKEGNLFISEVKHKSFVEVNEEGTEAAAVTSVEIRTTSIGSGIVFRADRPFIFAIREKASGTILFIGKIVNPT